MFIHFIDKRNDKMENTQHTVEVIFGDILRKEKLSQEQNVKLKNF